MTFADAKQRFSSRVADYVRYRPGYPTALLDLLHEECSLLPQHVIADIGSGTGLLSKLFLENGNRVFGIEPNTEMRSAGEDFLDAHRGFKSIDASAEATTLPDDSVDFVAAGQAFHWFDPVATRREFARILRPAGWAVVVWNDRRTSESPFGREYEDLLATFGTDYKNVKDAYPETHDMVRFFGEGRFRFHELPNFQEFDFDGLCGRLRSSSYAPQPGHPNHVPMMNALRKLFDANQRHGRVRMNYITLVYLGQLEGKPR